MSNIPSQWTTEGFMQRYEELLPLSKTYLATYLATETEHKTIFGKVRYNSHDSFRKTREQLLIKQSSNSKKRNGIKLHKEME